MLSTNLTNKRVRLIQMDDQYTNLKPGDEGTITGTDALNILVKWDNGSSLSLIPDIDKYEILNM